MNISICIDVSYILPCFVLQVHLVFIGNTSIIQTCLYVWSIHFMCTFHVRLILHNLGIPLPHEDGFSKAKNAYIKSAYYSTCDDYDIDTDETWMYEIGFIQLVMVFLVMR